MTRTRGDAGKHWLVRRKTIRGLWVGGIGILLILVAVDLMDFRHPDFTIEGWFGFYAGYGFLTCAVMVVFAKALGILLKRRDDYYDGR